MVSTATKSRLALQHVSIITGELGFLLNAMYGVDLMGGSAEVDCDVQQWVDTEGGVVGGNITTLLDTEKATVSNQLLSLFHGMHHLVFKILRN